MKFFDKKLKVGLSTFFVMVLIILEFGILDGYHFTSEGLSITIKNLNKDLGYNYIVMSIIIYVLTVGYSVYIGYKKNWGGLIGQLAIAACPLIGFAFMTSVPVIYNILFGWGTAHLIPALTVMNLHTARGGVLFAIFAAVFAIYAVAWYIGFLARKHYDAKNPW